VLNFVRGELPLGTACTVTAITAVHCLNKSSLSVLFFYASNASEKHSSEYSTGRVAKQSADCTRAADMFRTRQQ